MGVPAAAVRPCMAPRYARHLLYGVASVWIASPTPLWRCCFVHLIRHLFIGIRAVDYYSVGLDVFGGEVGYGSIRRYGRLGHHEHPFGATAYYEVEHHYQAVYVALHVYYVGDHASESAVGHGHCGYHVGGALRERKG